MSRPTRLQINPEALRANLKRVEALAPGKAVIAMVKANAYGCGIEAVAPTLSQSVSAFGVACLEEAMQVRALGIDREIILFQGIFQPSELTRVAELQLTVVINQPQQLQWLLDTALARPIKVWVKVNTGMNRLGFHPDEVADVLGALKACAWVQPQLSLMSHFACADEAAHPLNQQQIQAFANLMHLDFAQFSMANSAGIIHFPDCPGQVVRPGLMLYGSSPIAEQSAASLGLKPVLSFLSALSAVHSLPAGQCIGYGATHCLQRPSKIGIVAAGYGDGYPRHVRAGAAVWINGQLAPLIGRVSMDTLAVDLTDCQDYRLGDGVELWGEQLPVEDVARWAGTSSYELLCQISERVRFKQTRASGDAV